MVLNFALLSGIFSLQLTVIMLLLRSHYLSATLITPYRLIEVTCFLHAITANRTIYPFTPYKRSSVLLTPHKMSSHLVSLNSLPGWRGLCRLVPGASTSTETTSHRSPGPQPAVRCTLVSPMPLFPKLTPSCSHRGEGCLKVSICLVFLILCIFSSGSCVPGIAQGLP